MLWFSVYKDDDNTGRFSQQFETELKLPLERIWLDYKQLIAAKRWQLSTYEMSQ